MAPHAVCQCSEGFTGELCQHILACTGGVQCLNGAECDPGNMDQPCICQLDSLASHVPSQVSIVRMRYHPLFNSICLNGIPPSTNQAIQTVKICNHAATSHARTLELVVEQPMHSSMSL